MRKHGGHQSGFKFVPLDRLNIDGRGGSEWKRYIEAVQGRPEEALEIPADAIKGRPFQRVQSAMATVARILGVRLRTKVVEGVLYIWSDTESRKGKRA